MKILHAIQSADPAGGGPIEGILQLASATRSSCEHVVVSLDRPDAEFLSKLPVTVHALGPAGFLGYSSRLLPWLRRHRASYRIVMVHGLWRYVSFGCWRALRDGNVPYVVFPHGMLDPWFKHRYPLKHLKKLAFWPWTEYRLLRDARAVIFTCEEEKLRARKSFGLYRANEEVAVLGIGHPPMDVEAQRKAFCDSFPHLADKRVLLFLSRIHPKKGCDLLVEAFARTAALDERVHLVVAGPDATGWGATLRRDAENAGIAHRITWTGMLTGAVKWGAYRCADAFILPTHHENFGIVVAEALACGLPVLISDKVQIWREIIGHDAGCAESDTLQGTERLIRRWLEFSPAEWNAMRAHARACYTSEFDVDRYADRILALVELYAPERAPALSLAPQA